MGQFTEEQAKTLKDAYKTDANQVLSSIMEKIRQLDGLSQGTELGDVLSGFSQMQKSMLAPFKIMTSGLNEVKKSFKNFKELAEEEKKSKDKNNDRDVFDQSSNDLAKDESVLDLSEHIRNLIEQENVNLSAIEQSITEQHHFLQDIQNTVASLIYGTDAVVDQLRKNQKNTKVYQVSKKEMTLAEKAELSQGTTQIALLGNIQAQLEKLDEELTDSLVDAMDPQGQYQESLPDADFPPLDDDKKTHQPNIDEDDEGKKEEIGLLRKIAGSIGNGIRFIGHQLKVGAIAAGKTLLMLTGILAAIVGIDFVIALAITKWDQISSWLKEKLEDFGSWATDMKKIVDDAFNEYIVKPFDEFNHWLQEIKLSVVNLGANILEGLAQIAEMAGKDDWAESLNGKAAGMRIDQQIVVQKRWDEFAKTHGEEEAIKRLGERPVIEKAELPEGLSEKITQLAEQDREKGIVDTLNNQEKTLIQLNTSLEDLNALYRQAKSNGDNVSAEKIENFIEIKKNADDAYNKEYEKNKFWKIEQIFKSDKEIAQNEEDSKRLAEKAKYDYLKGLNVGNQELTLEIQRKVVDQINENERQEYMMQDAFGGGIPYGYEQTKNNVQVNNQNNNTNVHSAPLSVNNPRHYKQTQQNIGTK